ncbi:hypothetical protein CLU79DRAFT_554644 [Phycomyces nitens]|nr:hypothetical protein CLU79DRAFT_554644 [Phycomyces nitens]
MDTTPNPFATKNNTPLHPRETTPELYPENEAIYKTPEKQQSRLGLNSLDWDHYKNTPGHYQKSQDDISPFSSNLSPIHAAIATHVIENFQRQRTPIHKEQSPSPYREWHRSNPHSFEHGQGRQPVDQLETEKPSQSVNSIQKVQSPYREWHKRRRRSFEHRTVRPPDASILEQDSPTYIQAAQQFSQHSNMDFINESPSQRVGQKRMNTQHMDSPTRDHSSDSLKAYHEKALLEAKSRSQQEFIQRDNGWGGLFTELNETSVNQTRYHPIHESSPTNPDRQHSVPLLERTPVHQMSSRGSYSFAEEDAPDIFGM